MDETKKLQLHLSTASVLLLVAGAFLGLSGVNGDADFPVLNWTLEVKF